MIEVIIHSTGKGVCSFSDKEGDGLTVTFKDGTLREGFLSHKAFQQLIRMKLGQKITKAEQPEQPEQPRPEVKAALPTVPVNGPK